MILDKILAQTRAEVQERKTLSPPEALQERIADIERAPLDMASALSGQGVSIVAEIKRASPSRGVLNPGIQPGKLAVTYARAGAAAISVLTESPNFKGSPLDLKQARIATRSCGIPIPILRKDFIVDRYQLLEARLWGADAVLLIAAALDDMELDGLLQGALALGLSPLVEVHSQAELARVLPLEPPMIGINNRDLEDFSVDLGVTRRLRPMIPSGCVVVAESGIHCADDMHTLRSMDVHAALIGQALVTADDPAALLERLLEAGR